MVTDELNKLVTTETKAGKSQDEIIKSLSEKGWGKEDIVTAMFYVRDENEFNKHPLYHKILYLLNWGGWPHAYSDFAKFGTRPPTVRVIEVEPGKYKVKISKLYLIIFWIFFIGFIFLILHFIIIPLIQYHQLGNFNP